MSTTPNAHANPDQPHRRPPDIHRERRIAESFGTGAAQYDSTRPPYPQALVDQVIESARTDSMNSAEAVAPLSVLDVGCGTGIAARQFQAAGCTVLGLEPDARMAGFARSRGTEVEVSTFEDWDRSGRRFDIVTAAQSWHWIDSAVGAAKAAEALRPSGCLAVFGHVFEPPQPIATAFAEAFRRSVPDSPFAGSGRRPTEVYEAGYESIAHSLRDSGSFAEVERLRFDWTRTYQRDEWLALLTTTGGLTTVAEEPKQAILSAVGETIDHLGGSFEMNFTTLATTGITATA